MSDDSLCPFCGEPEKVTLHYGSHDSYGQPIEPDEYENEGCTNTNCPNSGLFCLMCDEVLQPEGNDIYRCLNEACGQRFDHLLCELPNSPKPHEASKAFFRGLGRIKEAV